jgi:GT2 family glycosyltransferase
MSTEMTEPLREHARFGETVDVSVCVPVYRSHAAPNIAALGESMSGALEGMTGELVVALNGIDATAAGVPEQALTVDLGVNRGVAPGWNAAASVARGRTLVFANDDVVLGRGALAQLAHTLEDHQDAGVVGPLGALWELSRQRHVEWVEPTDLAPGELRRCDAVSGFLMAARREVYERAGGFDERYAPCTWEELDLCTTVRVRLGLECYVVGGVKHEHEFHISSAPPWRRLRYDGHSEMLWRIHHRNARYFRRKWAGAV